MLPTNLSALVLATSRAVQVGETPHFQTGDQAASSLSTASRHCANLCTRAYTTFQELPGISEIGANACASCQTVCTAACIRTTCDTSVHCHGARESQSTSYLVGLHRHVSMLAVHMYSSPQDVMNTRYTRLHVHQLQVHSWAAHLSA